MNNNDLQGSHKTSTLPTDVSNFHAFSKMYKSQKTITSLQNPNATPEISSFQIIKIHWWTYPFLLKKRFQNVPQMLCSMLNGWEKKILGAQAHVLKWKKMPRYNFEHWTIFSTSNAHKHMLSLPFLLIQIDP